MKRRCGGPEGPTGTVLQKLPFSFRGIARQRTRQHLFDPMPCQKRMLDSGNCKKLGMSWATFCREWAGVENRKRVLAAVEKMRGKAAPKSNADTIRRKLDAVVAELKAMEPTGSERLVLIGALDEGARKLGGMAHELRAKALSLG